MDISGLKRRGLMFVLSSPSGAGKTTISSLLLKFYEPVSGDIIFDGEKSINYELSLLRNEMAVVPQDVMLFNGSIKENIMYGDTNATEQEVIEAAKNANPSLCLFSSRNPSIKCT